MREPILLYHSDRELWSTGAVAVRPLAFTGEISKHSAEDSRICLLWRARSARIWTRPLTRKAVRTFRPRGWGSAGDPDRREFDGGAQDAPMTRSKGDVAMKANDIMTTDVVSVRPDTTTRTVAKLLSAHGISAVPVVDEAGAPVGMVSEGDLIGRSDEDRRARRDWWLTLLAEGEELPSNFLASLREPARAVRDVMSSPVISVGEDTEPVEIAKLLASHHIKRVPVVRDGRVVGIVSRADIVRAMAADATVEAVLPRRGGLFAEAVSGVEDRFHRVQDHSHMRGAVAKPSSVAVDETWLSADDFRALVEDHERRQARHKRADRDSVAEQRHRRIAALINEHISDASWRQLLHHAHEAAEGGDREFMLLRFPSGLCSDGGRAINSELPGWPQTLRGEAAEIYTRWEQDLKPQGFPITARVLDFPGGMPGDVGLFLDWGV